MTTVAAKNLSTECHHPADARDNITSFAIWRGIVSGLPRLASTGWAARQISSRSCTVLIIRVLIIRLLTLSEEQRLVGAQRRLQPPELDDSSTVRPTVLSVAIDGLRLRFLIPNHCRHGFGVVGVERSRIRTPP